MSSCQIYQMKFVLKNPCCLVRNANVNPSVLHHNYGTFPQTIKSYFVFFSFTILFTSLHKVLYCSWNKIRNICYRRLSVVLLQKNCFKIKTKSPNGVYNIIPSEMKKIKSHRYIQTTEKRRKKKTTNSGILPTPHYFKKKSKYKLHRSLSQSQ